MKQKKSKIPANVLNKFNKVLYKPGDQVTIKWLGEIKQGYVKKTKKTSDGVQYLVEAGTTYSTKVHRYPCGIQIGEHTTNYTAGLILHDQAAKTSAGATSRVSEDTGGTVPEVRNDSTSSREHADSDCRKNAGTGSNNTTAANVKSSNARNRSNSKTTRNADAVTEAVKRQQDFLRGFVKK